MRLHVIRNRTRFIELATVISFTALLAGATGLHPWSEQARLRPNDPGAGDYFGQRVDLEGDTLIVGDEMDDSPASDAGSAYLFTRRNGLVWSQKAKLTAADQASGDHFGSGVGISASNAVVGAYSDDLPSSKANAGSAYVFAYASGTWVQRKQLTASDKEADDNFGAAVDIDDDTIVVGAPLNDDPVAGTDAGAAYVFVRSGTNWVQQAILLASDRSADDRFGNAVAIDTDAVVIGAWQADNTGAAYSGAAYVFVRSGTNWSQQARLVSGDIVAGDSFGRAVGISGDTVVIGADYCNGPSMADSGAGYVFKRSGVTWSQQAKLTASDRAASDQLGIGVAVCSNLAALATVNSLPAGAAYLFARSGSNWTEQVRLVPTNVIYGHSYANAVALSGETLAATAYRDDTPAGDNAGSAYVLILDDDGDGLSDGFERAWGTQPTIADSDDDGLSDYAEYLAGSNPTNGTSAGFPLQEATRAPEGAGIVLTWPGLAERLYDVELTPLLSAGWKTVVSNSPGAGTPMSYTNTGAATSAFIRVGVRLAP